MSPVVCGIAAVFMVLNLGCALSGLGPPEDHSQFLTARLTMDGTVGVFTYHHLVYRPAVGWRAFPDGGVPKYLIDRQIIGTYNLKTGRTRVIHRQDNREWQNGDGRLSLSAVCGRTALVIESGWRRNGDASELRHYWLDILTGQLARFALQEELAKIGRGLGYYYLIKPDRTLVLVTPPLTLPASVSWTRDPSWAEIWLRRPSGRYHRLAQGIEYHGMLQDEVHFWDLADRTIKVFHLDTGEITMLARLDPRFLSSDEPVVDLGISLDKRSLELRRKVGDEWRAEKLAVELKMLQGKN